MDVNRVVQFLYPGGEHGWDRAFTATTGWKDWNRGDHKRKFLVAEGWCTRNPTEPPARGSFTFWGEWEPQSEVRRLVSNEGAHYPSWLHTPRLRLSEVAFLPKQIVRRRRVLRTCSRIPIPWCSEIGSGTCSAVNFQMCRAYRRRWLDCMRVTLSFSGAISTGVSRWIRCSSLGCSPISAGTIRCQTGNLSYTGGSRWISSRSRDAVYDYTGARTGLPKSRFRSSRAFQSIGFRGIFRDR